MSDALTEVRERRAGLRAAMAEVESAIAEPAPGREADWRTALDSSLERLARALDSHIAATEAADGLLQEIVQSAPRLTHATDKVRADHVALRDEVASARATVASGAEVPALRDLVVELLVHLVRHRHSGADLVYEAYMVDIEAAD